VIEHYCEAVGRLIWLAFFLPAARLRGTNAYAVNGVCPVCQELHGRVITAAEHDAALARLAEVAIRER
jgi:hypothetical protein